MSDLERFLSRTTPGPNGCLLWTGSTCHQGYAAFGAGGRTYRAHRWYYEQVVGPVPRELHLDHLCRVRHCVNPAHLEPVTSRENTMRGEGLAAKNAKKTHCLRGHEFSPENTRLVKGHERECITCMRKLQIAYLRRRKAKQRPAPETSP